MNFKLGQRVRGVLDIFQPGDMFKSKYKYIGTITHVANERLFIVMENTGVEVLVDFDEGDTIEDATTTDKETQNTGTLQ